MPDTTADHVIQRVGDAGFEKIAPSKSVGVPLLSVQVLVDQLNQQKLANELVQDQRQLMATQESQAGKTNPGVNMSEAEPQHTGGISKWAFVFVSLTLPFIGAVAAGDGAACLHRRERLDHALGKAPQ